MAILSRLFGKRGGDAPAEAPETYAGFAILADPVKESGGFRVAARIEKTVDGQALSHRLIRADVCSTMEQAAEISVLKAKALIDEKGDRLFD